MILLGLSSTKEAKYTRGEHVAAYNEKGINVTPTQNVNSIARVNKLSGIIEVKINFAKRKVFGIAKTTHFTNPQSQTPKDTINAADATESTICSHTDSFDSRNIA